MSIEIRSFNQILGNMVRKILAETPLSDVNAGSVLLSLLEACAANDFDNNVAILNLLELLNIDAVRNNDLDSRAADYGLIRLAAQKASGFVTVTNSNITKQSTSLYAIKPAPISGQNVLYVNDTAGWSASGTLYIGRGTESFEGPIPYTSITTYPTYSEIQLGSALQKNHLSSDTVINAQGQPDRIINAGTIVKIPANNESPEVLYSVLRSATLPAGETEISNVPVIALQAGSLSNALINTVTQFDSSPFSGATVTNTTSFSGGTDIETDTQLRNRIKSYATTLARGTAPSIISAVIGVSDQTDSKRVVSAAISESVSIGEPSILHIDDGTGFQPSYAGQSVDVLVSNANGTEEYLQLANFPLPRPQVVNTAIDPYTLSDSMFLRVAVDDEEDTIYISESDFINISAATLSEVVAAINSRSTIFKARLTNNSQSILVYPTAADAEIIQITPLRSTDVESLYMNSVLKFPTDETSYISLFHNNDKLVQKSKAASVETMPFASWGISSTGNLVLSVDGTPAQSGSFVLSDFESGPSSWGALVLDDWVIAFNKKFAGITAVATTSQTMKISSNKIGTNSSIAVSGGTYLSQMFADLNKSSTGQISQFEINRQTGNVKILADINTGDSVTAGIEDAKGFVLSSVTSSGLYNVSNDAAGRPAEMVIVADSNYCDSIALELAIGTAITISDEGSSVMRIMAGTLTALADVQPGHFIYLTSRTSGWLSSNNCGIFKVIKRGTHQTAGVDSYVEVLNNNITAESASVIDVLDIKAFNTDGYPQIWRGVYAVNPPAATITDVVSSFNASILGIKASVFRSSSIKLSSVTETGGSIAIPVSVANAAALFSETNSVKQGNRSQIANKIADKDLFGLFKRTAPNIANVWLNRETVQSVFGPISTNYDPDTYPYAAPYSEIVESSGILTPSNVNYSDIVAFTAGNNKNLLKPISAYIATDSVGTLQGLPRTELDHVIGDEVTLFRSLNFNADDNIVFILDKDPGAKTIDVKLARTGKVNSGSNALSFLPTTTEFSADDSDNEPGIDFGNLNSWGTSVNGTDFSDYALLMRARNWYSSGGVSGSDGKMLIRSNSYGVDGNLIRFSIEYPQTPDTDNTTLLLNTPSYNLISYYFGSSSAHPVAISSGSNISVSGPYPDSSTNFPNGATSSGDYYDYTFSSGTFAPVAVGDVLSIISGSGVSDFNSGKFGIKAISGNTIRVFNPNGSPTSPGTPTVSTITTIADVVGTPTNVSITVTSAATLDGTYLVAYDNAGTVKIWFDVDNNGTAEPVSPAFNRTIRIATILNTDTASQVATKIAAYLSNDVAFANVFSTPTQVIYDLAQNGPVSSPYNGSPSPGFSYSVIAGTADQSLSGKYFTVYDDEGSVAIWYDVGDVGTQEPFHGAQRSIRVYTFSAGASDSTVAAATAAAVNADSKFSASSLTNVVTIATSFNASVPVTSAGTSGFSVSTVQGSLTTAELISNAGLVYMFPLTKTAVSDIVDKLNEGKIVTAAAIGSDSLTITLSTAEESYVYGGNSTALGYGHDPSSPSLRGYVSLQDGINWIKSFSNSNPNFTLKTSLTLNGVAPSVYSMNTAPNEDATVGEYFKLVPTTVKNVHHHLTQKALSQLPIIADISVSNAGRNVQIKSNKLGSNGAIEVVGGQANEAKAYIIGEPEISSDMSGNYLLTKINAFPHSFSVGDIVKLENDAGVKRLSRLVDTDTITVTNPSSNTMEYNYDAKITNFSAGTAFTIVDVSATYSKPAGTVWRWTHSGGGATLADVIPGDLLMAYGSLSGWDQSNKANISGDGRVSGLPIINVNDGSNWIDVVNPRGKAMLSTAIGMSGTVQICPAPAIKWNLAHYARTSILSMVCSTNVVTVTCSNAHFLNSGDNVDIIDSDYVTDGVYSGITVTSATTFTFSYISPDFTEGSVGATLLNGGVSRTRYKLEKLGLNGLVKLSHVDGNSPRFADCGVAVDDYLVLNGSTFSSNNNGTYRVLAVDNDYVMFMNENAGDDINTVVPFNNKGLLATWTSNLNIVTGIAGTFKNLSVGDWVKKSNDPDSAYLQVINFSPATPALATQIVLGGNYSGTSAVDAGVSYDQVNDHEKGVYLQSSDDVSFYEGDSVMVGDTLYVQNIVNANWFNTNNAGSFEISEWGTNGVTYKPFLRVTNPVGVAEANRSMSVNIEGFYITESFNNKFYTYRQITNSCLDYLDDSRRSLFLSPASRQYKFSEANNTSMTHASKLGYNNDVTVGTDGYLYYTGLLQRVQRIVDGFEPDPANFPGRRAVGGLIETLPPLIKNITIAVTVTTNEGYNISDISNNIKSTIITYIEELGVGEDVILSEIIARVMQLKGVLAVTFNTPTPSTERIVVAKDEKAIISPENIGIA